MRVALSGGDKGLLFVSGNALDDDSASLVPVELLGRLLDPTDLRKLERMLLKNRSSTRSTQRTKPSA
jgi:hypothetical protein